MELTELEIIVYGVLLLLCIPVAVIFVVYNDWRADKDRREAETKRRSEEIAEYQRLLAKRTREDFAWYRATYPACVSGGGRVTCFSCGGNRLHTAHFRDATQMRGHYCVTCGETLYYSRESE